MITMEDWVTIKNLKRRRPDLGTRKIAGLLGFSRNTVKRALTSETGPCYNRKSRINPEIEKFKDYIYEQLVVKKLRGSRVLNDISSKGYKGSKSAFYRYISKIKKPAGRTFRPYQTGPGEQAQFDWSPYTVLIGGKLTKVIVFNYILGFSRKRVYEASLTATQGSIFEALENSFYQTGGVPERVQTDNDKSFVTNSSRENFQWNKRYLQFAGHYGFKPSRSLPGHPWSKGKVEKPFEYLEDHFIKGNQFFSFEDFLIRLKKFEREVNNQIHGTTHQRPDELFEKEKDSLSPLPSSRYVDVKEQARKVTADCLISFDGNRYSVPWQFATREVWVKVSKGYYLTVYSSQNALIATHKLAITKGNVIINQDHYKNHRIDRGNWDRLSQMFLHRFPYYEWFLEKLKAQKRINPSYHLTQILEISKFYHPDDMINAFKASEEYNVFSSVFVQGFLENHSQMELNVSRLNWYDHSKYKNTNIKRPLEYYQIVLKEKQNHEKR